MLEEKNDNLSTENDLTDGKQESVLAQEQESENQADTPVDSEIVGNAMPDAETAIEKTEQFHETDHEEIIAGVGENANSEQDLENMDLPERTEGSNEKQVKSDETPEQFKAITDENNGSADENTASVENTFDQSPENVNASESGSAEPEIQQNTDSDENVIALSPEQLADDRIVVEDESIFAINAIAAANAEDGENDSPSDALPMQEYESMSMEALTDELEKVSASENIMSVKGHIEEIKKSFLLKYHEFIEEKKDEFHAENPETADDFHYHFPLKTKFDQLYAQFRDRKNKHFKGLQTNLQSNLENRLAIVEELKNLINPQENIKDTLKHFNDLRDRWKLAGPIPKDKYNHVWNNYHFHVENFYDYLHLDREARDIDFKHNLEQKQKIITRVEDLVNEPDINKAFRELQDLHRLWKEDIGPVSREHREAIWDRFSDLTKQMHDKRETLFESQRAVEQENLSKKKEIISQIESLAQEKVSSHALWLGQIEKVEALRNQFFAAGKVSPEFNEEAWSAFKTAVRNFNALKNSFYKDIKKDQNDNLNRKQELVAKAKELQESTDFAATTPIMKQIQEEWKQIGHVPRKFSDKLWNEFKNACNSYFEKLKEQRSEENAEEMAAFDKKKDYLDSLRDFDLVGEHKTDLDAIKAHIETWKSFGKVPFGRRHIEGKFNKVLDTLFEKLSLSKKDTEMMRFSNRVEQMTGSEDTRKLENEKIFLMRKIDEIQSEILQLENNIQFFTNTKNAKKENSIVLDVRKNIEKHREELDVLKQKLKQIKSMGQQ